jgi:hypothetical protein
MDVGVSEFGEAALDYLRVELGDQLLLSTICQKYIYGVNLLLWFVII